MNRRRPREDDDDAEHGGFKKRQKHGSETQDIEDRLTSLILHVGVKSTSSLESNLHGLANVLESDLNTYKSKILALLVDCAVKMPEKCSVYTTLVGLINVKNYNFGGEFVDLLVRSYKEAMKNCEWDAARSALRFMSDLVNCHVISANSLLQLYRNLIEAAFDDKVPQNRRDVFVYSILLALPWVGRELFEKKEQAFDGILTSIEIYLKRRDKTHVAMLKVWSNDVPHPQEDYLDCLWAQIMKMQQDLWQEKHIHRPYLAFDSELCEALQHNLPNIIPPPHQDSYKYPLSWVVFRIFDYTDCPELGPILPGSHSIERFLIEEHLHLILEHNRLERKDCAAYLLSFPQKHKIPLEYMIVEVIFSEMLQLPFSKYLEICYGSILIELCKLQPSTMPQVLAQASELLFERIEYMNTTCFDRFVSWFSYHLSNFQFRWSWEDWSEALKLDVEHPKPKFLREVFQKCLRLSYLQRISEVTPESFSFLLPTKPDPDFKYSQENAEFLPGALSSKKLREAILRKCSPEEAIAALSDISEPEPMITSSAGDPPISLKNNNNDNNSSGVGAVATTTGTHCSALKIDVFVQTLFHMGSKSLSHVFAAITKFHSVFKELATSEEAQICVLKSMFELWHHNEQIMIILVDKLLKIQVIECAAVANWLFSKDMAGELTKLYVWDILHLTIRKMNNHVQKLEKDLLEARVKVQAGESDSSDSDVVENITDGGAVVPKKKVKKDRPSEEVMEAIEEKFETAQADQKNLFLIIFQRFIMNLSEHLVRCDTDGSDFRTHWYKWTTNRLQQVFCLHFEQVKRYSETLETLLFTQDLDVNLLKIFQQFKALAF